MLHAINPARLRFIQQNCPVGGLRVLDIGCGGGILSEAMAKQGAIVTGLDVSDENITIAAAHSAAEKLEITYINSSAEDYAVNHHHQFNLITCMELLEHVPDPASIIRACADMVKPQGHVILSTINRTLKAYLLGVLVGEYLTGLLPRGTHRYENFIRPSELVNCCRAHGLKPNKLNGLSVNPLIRRYAPTQNPDINYLLDCIRTND